jgi:hypothetical protein
MIKNGEEVFNTAISQRNVIQLGKYWITMRTVFA